MEMELKPLVDALKLELGINQRETLNLTKNTKGYNWDIKVFFGESDDVTLERMVALNNKMVERFSSFSEDE